MCGRFALSLDPADLAEAFPEIAFPPGIGPRFNIAPTQPILVLPNDGRQQADFFRWGLIPSWAKDASIGARLINARAETLAEKPAFRSAYKYRRCLIFADAFFEWQSRPGAKTKIPHLIRLKSGAPFAFAGLWEIWQPADGSEVRTAAIITTIPNELIAPIHNRMPVILSPSAYAQWIDPAPLAPAALQGLLAPYPANEMTASPVSTLVNDPANDRPEIFRSL
jgi:putative SOS response-associated peptidase YedK